MFNHIYNLHPEWNILPREQIIGRALRMTRHSNIPISFQYHNIIESKPTNYTKPIDYAEDLECGICIGSYDSIQYCEVSCSHKFHSHCVGQWIKTKIDNQSTITCPNCRDELKKIEKLPEYNEEEKVVFDKICRYFANFKCECEKNYQPLFDIETSSLDSDDEPSTNIECKCECGFDCIKALFEDGIYYVNIQGFSKLKITWDLIEWFVKTYLKSTDGLMYLNYLSKEKKYTHRLFGISGLSINSKHTIITIGGKQIKTTLAQANFAIWFANNKLIEKIVEIHKLFLIPKSFL